MLKRIHKLWNLTLKVEQPDGELKNAFVRSQKSDTRDVRVFVDLLISPFSQMVYNILF